MAVSPTFRLSAKPSAEDDGPDRVQICLAVDAGEGVEDADAWMLLVHYGNCMCINICRHMMLSYALHGLIIDIDNIYIYTTLYCMPYRSI